MDADHVGPLSYDVTAPELDPSAQRGILWGLLAVVVSWALAVVGGWFALGLTPDPRSVHRFFPLAVLGAGVGAAAWGSRESYPRARRISLLTIGAIAAVASVFAYTTLSTVKPTLPQIRQYLDDAALPPGFRVVSEETRGDRLCRVGCPRVDRVYAAPENDADPVRTMVLAMFEAGWEQAADVPRDQATTARRGAVFLQLAEIAPHTVRVTASRQS